MTPFRLAALAVMLLLPAACSSWNPLVALGIRSESANKPTPLTEIRATVTPRLAWTAQAGKAGDYRFRPEIEGGRVYAVDAEGTITIVDEASGSIATRVETKKQPSGGLEVAEGRIFLGTSKGEVVALDAAGKPLWATHVAGEVIAPPAVAADTVIVRTTDSRVFGLALADGKRRWVYQRPTPALLLRSTAGVVPVGGQVLAGFPNGKLVALDAADGKLAWEVNVHLPRGATELERIADIAGLPLVDGRNVCAGAYQGKVGCFDMGSRNAVWTRDLSTALAPARDARHLYVVDDAGAVHALDKGTGASVWTQDKLQHRRLTPPLVHDGKVVVGDGFGFIHVLSPDDGALVGRLATDGSRVLWLVPAKDGFLMQTGKGSLSLVKF